MTECINNHRQVLLALARAACVVMALGVAYSLSLYFAGTLSVTIALFFLLSVISELSWQGMPEGFRGKLYLFTVFVMFLAGIAVVEQATALQDNSSLESIRLREALLELKGNVLATDSRGIITQVSPCFCELSGYSHNELLGKNISSILPGTDVILRAKAPEAVWTAKSWNTSLVRSNGVKLSVNKTLVGFRSANVILVSVSDTDD